tara:strand:- start:9982 stop:10344 length:363 start_codon:yes stop_codon:yes gene_type:complete
MDFITWPELLLSIVAVLSVFLGLSGAMLMVATQLAEDGPWFRVGVLTPLGIGIVGFLIGGAAQLLFVGIALAVAIASPVRLAMLRRVDCLPAIATGLGLFLVGGVGVVSTVSAHYTYFVR